LGFLPGIFRLDYIAPACRSGKQGRFFKRKKQEK
jgi:hypothetical protein